MGSEEKRSEAITVGINNGINRIEDGVKQGGGIVDGTLLAWVEALLNEVVDARSA